MNTQGNIRNQIIGMMLAGFMIFAADADAARNGKIAFTSDRDGNRRIHEHAAQRRSERFRLDRALPVAHVAEEYVNLPVIAPYGPPFEPVVELRRENLEALLGAR